MGTHGCLPRLTPLQAYDGHMNLILSDVEETIMIVEQAEGAPEGSGTVNVCVPDYHVLDKFLTIMLGLP